MAEAFDQGDTVDFIHEKLSELIKAGRGKERVWVDLPLERGDAGTLYVGDDEDADDVGAVDVNG